MEKAFRALRHSRERFTFRIFSEPLRKVSKPMSIRMIKRNWLLDPGKFLSGEETQRLRIAAEEKATAAVARGSKTPVRDYFIVDLALSTGLRVMELAQLKCRDIFSREHLCAIRVRKGKGKKKRLVRFNNALRKHYQQYMKWKEAVGEPVGPDDPLLFSTNSRSHMTTRGIQKAFKRTAARAGLPSRYSIHCLRHTYATELYNTSSHNLRLVQKQLGHAFISTTQVYADVLEPDMQRALEKLYTSRRKIHSQ